MEYKESVDYFSLMMRFAQKFPQHNADHWNRGYPRYGTSLSEINRQLCQHKDYDFLNHFWWKWYVQDVRQVTGVGTQLKADLSLKVTDGSDNWIFLTLNFNDTEPITAQKMLHFAQEICKKSWVAKAEYVLEKHRINGVHHHVHMLIDLAEEIRKGKIVELVYKIAGLKKYCAGKQYVDVKTKKDLRAERNVYFSYVRGDKKNEKLVYVDKDKVWRAHNNIFDLYEYEK